MNRRDFLSRCVATGMTIGFGGLLSCVRPIAPLSQADRDQLRGLLIADAHAHPYNFHVHRNPKYDPTTPTIEMMKQVGMVACSFSAVGDMVKNGNHIGMPYSDTFDQLRKVKHLESEKKIFLILKSADIGSLVPSNDLLGAIMAIEGGDALEGKISNLDRFYDYGVRMMTVMHNHDNEIGFNTLSKSDGPLTPFGKKVIEKMNESEMIVDVSHSKTKTFNSILEVSKAPVIDSHTNPLPYKAYRGTTRRTWSDCELIAKSNGVIFTWPLTRANPNSTLRDWAEEIVLMKKRLGIEHCGLGTDGGGSVPGTVNGWVDITSLPNLIRAMREVGLSQEDIAAYVGGNFLRVLNKCLA
ncbi:MAG: membrane dipeptidase [Syntrophales bacterium]|nr:membrane dipeptidase [Syntrophales bacterium]